MSRIALHATRIATFSFALLAIHETSARADELPPTPEEPAYDGRPRRDVFAPRLEITVAGAGMLRSIFSVPMYMGGGELGVGGRVGKHAALRLAFDYEIGQSRHGLTTNVAEGVGVCEGVWDRFRFGGGTGLLRFSLTRATTGDTLAHFGVAARLVTSFDFVQTDAVAIYVGARGEADWMFSGTLLTAGLSLGFRLTPPH
jgi:hypothetical protein